MPRTFGELMQLVSNSTNAAVRQASKQQQHVLQLLLMSEDWGSITLELAGAALAAAEQLQQLQQQQQAAQGQQQQPDGDGDADEQMEDDGTLSGVEDEGARMSAESASGVLRFTAHVALCLRALGLMPDHNWSADEDEEAEWGRYGRQQQGGRNTGTFVPPGETGVGQSALASTICFCWLPEYLQGSVALCQGNCAH